MEGRFEPKTFLRRVNGSEYLEVKWRLVWLRREHPDAQISTTLISHENDLAVFRAEVVVPGGGSATGHGSERVKDFADYLEKAETKAIGRALAGLGFGTQFCPDYEFGNGNGKQADPRSASVSQSSRTATADDLITPNQMLRIRSIARARGWSDQSLNSELSKRFRIGELEQLGRRNASSFISEFSKVESGVPATA